MNGPSTAREALARPIAHPRKRERRPSAIMSERASATVTASGTYVRRGLEQLAISLKFGVRPKTDLTSRRSPSGESRD